ncbi:MAG: helix-turn-helix transcriptional regulator [Clostridia bacterium]|nr:helix-turn-helix transcriptional regulator [Clostridia bacterium]MBR5427238.1 helix-turn-helix transcriptional regulator [Clostridia bacterium]
MDIGTATRIRILNLCKEHGLSLNMLATVSGITQSTLQNVTSGRNKSTTVSTVKKICDGLGITVREFFDDDIFDNLEQEIK